MDAPDRASEDMARVSLMSGAGRGALLRWAVAAIATLVCCWLAALRLDWSELGSTIGELRLLPLTAALAALVGFYLLRALRWRVILGGAQSISDSFAMSSIGYLVNSALPLQGGELVKVGLLHKRTAITYARGLASILTERTLDVGAIVLLVGASLAYGTAVGAPEVAHITPSGLFASLSTWAAAVVAVFCVSALSVWILSKIFDANDRLLSLGGRVRRAAVNSFVETWQVIKVRPASFQILGLTVAAWGLNLVSVWLTTRAVGLEMTPLEVSLCFGLVTLGLSVPLTPGYVGQYELLWLEVMTLTGINLGPAGDHLPLVLHAMILLTVLGLGVSSLVFLAWRSRADRGSTSLVRPANQANVPGI
jgi:uncharacterized protein (TIRG00374 family)